MRAYKKNHSSLFFSVLLFLLFLLLLLLIYDSQAILIVGSALRSENTVCGARNTQRNRSQKGQGQCWVKSSMGPSMGLFLRSHSVNQGRTKAAESAVSTCASKGPVLSCIRVIIHVYKQISPAGKIQLHRNPLESPLNQK